MRSIPLVILVCLFSRTAAAQVFAQPPDGDPPRVDDDGGPLAPPQPLPEEDSTVRLSVGPALRISDQAPAGGLAAAVDLGSGATGARISGTWSRVGSDHGAAEYRGEIFIDFGAGERLHPILGAGAGVARLDVADAGEVKGFTYGVGVVRGTLEYVLPVARTDARAGIDVVGSVPAVHGRGAPDPGPWLVLVGRVGVGF
jgi:hypothetical protein